jgi:hypothetical protein
MTWEQDFDVHTCDSTVGGSSVSVDMYVTEHSVFNWYSALNTAFSDDLSKFNQQMVSPIIIDCCQRIGLFKAPCAVSFCRHYT